jgi:hypothetical protein
MNRPLPKVTLTRKHFFDFLILYSIVNSVDNCVFSAGAITYEVQIL